MVGVDIRKIGKIPIYIGKSPVFGPETLRDTKIKNKKLRDFWKKGVFVGLRQIGKNPIKIGKYK